MTIKIIEMPVFRKAAKKLHANQKKDLDAVIRALMKDPLAGELKTGDLAEVRVYKFKMVKQLTLLAYVFEDATITLTLLAVGSHENFYRDLKN